MSIVLKPEISKTSLTVSLRFDTRRLPVEPSRFATDSSTRRPALLTKSTSLKLTRSLLDPASMRR